MNTQSKILDQDVQDFLAPDEDGAATPEHEAWIEAEIDARLARRAAGQTKYKSLDSVMTKFGFDAR